MMFECLDVSLTRQAFHVTREVPIAVDGIDVRTCQRSPHAILAPAVLTPVPSSTCPADAGAIPHLLSGTATATMSVIFSATRYTHARHLRAQLALMHARRTGQRDFALLLIARILEALIPVRTACRRPRRRRLIGRPRRLHQPSLHIAHHPVLPIGSTRWRSIAVIRVIKLDLVISAIAILAAGTVIVHHISAHIVVGGMVQIMAMRHISIRCPTSSVPSISVAEMQRRTHRRRLGRIDDGVGLLGGEFGFESAFGQGADGPVGVEGRGEVRRPVRGQRGRS